jgi:cobyrinic acid a,c-diamide synthase
MWFLLAGKGGTTLNNSYPRLMLAAPKSGSGKTMMTCGLLNALLIRKLSCRSFKCGPDYIDPMFHKYVLGIDGGNLDTFFLDKEQVREQFSDQARGAGISVIEGVMGYYDGVGGDTTEASSYEVACALDTPVVLVLDCKGASLSLAAVVKGFLEYKENSHIKGVILNRTSSVMAERLKPVMEELGVHVYGYLPECKEGALGSRHLGLVLPGELKGLKDQLNQLAMKLETTIDINGLIKLAQDARPLPPSQAGLKRRVSDAPIGREVLIGMALDEAFCFYYQENLRLLKEMGAKLIPFSPIHDKRLPSGIHGFLLGGGYPELYCRELSENKSMLRDIRQASERGLPILAECGGFLYLHDQLETKDHETYPMAGIIHGKAFWAERLLRFGYIEAFPKADIPFLKKGESIRGHEFHYWDSTNNGACMEAKKPGGRKSWDCVHGKGNLLAGFPHFYYPSNPALPKRFVEACRELKEGEE